MDESVEKLPEQSVVSRTLALRAKMAKNDLYKQYVYFSVECEDNLSGQRTDSTFFDDWDDWYDKISVV